MAELIVTSYRYLGYLRQEYEDEIEDGRMELWAISCTTPEFDPATERLIKCVPELAPSEQLHYQMTSWKKIAAFVRGGMDPHNAEDLMQWVYAGDPEEAAKRKRDILNLIEFLDGEDFAKGPEIYAREYAAWFKKHGAKRFTDAMNLIKKGTSVVFLCWEKTAKECHRGMLAELAKKYVNVEYIEPDGKVRNTRAGQEVDDPIIEIPGVIVGHLPEVQRIVNGRGANLDAEEFDGRTLFQNGFTTLGGPDGAHSAPSQAQRLRAGGGDGWIPYEYLGMRGTVGYEGDYDEYVTHCIHGHASQEDDLVQIRRDEWRRRREAETEERSQRCVEEPDTTRVILRTRILKKAEQP